MATTHGTIGGRPAGAARSRMHQARPGWLWMRRSSRAGAGSPDAAIARWVTSWMSAGASCSAEATGPPCVFSLPPPERTVTHVGGSGSVRSLLRVFVPGVGRGLLRGPAREVEQRPMLDGGEAGEVPVDDLRRVDKIVPDGRARRAGGKRLDVVVVAARIGLAQQELPVALGDELRVGDVGARLGRVQEGVPHRGARRAAVEDVHPALVAA